MVRRLAWSNLAAQCAEQIAISAAALVTVVALGGGVGESGAIQAAQTLPFLLFAVPAGLFADRFRRRTVMGCAEAVRAASLLAVCVLASTGSLTWPLLAALGLLGGCATVAFMVVAPALVPALVPPAGLAQANSRIELARTVAFAAGPALGGAALGWAGAVQAFALAAMLSIVSALLLFGVHEPARTAPPQRRAVEEILEGARFLSGHRMLRPVFVTQFFFNAAFYVLLAAFVPHAVDAMGLSASTVGAVLGAYGVGMVAGALGAAHVMRSLRFGVVVALGPVTGLGGALAIAMTSVTPSPALAAAGFFLLGAGPLIWVVSTTTLRQVVTPAHLLGRVSAIGMLASGARPLGAGIGAIVGAVYGAQACLWLALLGFAIQAAVILASAVVRMRVLAAV